MEKLEIYISLEINSPEKAEDLHFADFMTSVMQKMQWTQWMVAE